MCQVTKFNAQRPSVQWHYRIDRCENNQPFKATNTLRKQRQRRWRGDGVNQNQERTTLHQGQTLQISSASPVTDVTTFVRHSTTSSKPTVEVSTLSFCSQCCFLSSSVQRKRARSDNFCGPDQQAVTEKSILKHDVGLIVLARQVEESENNTWQTESSTHEVAKSFFSK